MILTGRPRQSHDGRRVCVAHGTISSRGTTHPKIGRGAGIADTVLVSLPHPASTSQAVLGRSGRAAGLSLETMLAVLRHTDAQSYWLFNYLAPRLARGDFDDGANVACEQAGLARFEG